MRSLDSPSPTMAMNQYTRRARVSIEHYTQHPRHEVRITRVGPDLSRRNVVVRTKEIAVTFLVILSLSGRTKSRASLSYTPNLETRKCVQRLPERTTQCAGTCYSTARE